MPQPVPSETLYRKAGRRYVPVEERFDRLTRFPAGSWVLVVEPGHACCVTRLPDVSDAVVAALQKFRPVLEDALADAARLRPDQDRTPIPEEKWEKIKAVLGDKPLWLTGPSVGDAVRAAVEKFAQLTLGTKAKRVRLEKGAAR